MNYISRLLSKYQVVVMLADTLFGGIVSTYTSQNETSKCILATECQKDIFSNTSSLYSFIS